MADSELPGVLERIRDLASRSPGLELLILFGSRARGDVHVRSDWDFGYLATRRADLPALMSTLVETTGSDRVDLVDLRRASGVLRFRAARDGQVIYESQAGLGTRFRLEAAHFWCEMAPILQPALEEVLTRLDR
jgi:predicted nucleotidyltransferase